MPYLAICKGTGRKCILPWKELEHIYSGCNAKLGEKEVSTTITFGYSNLIPLLAKAILEFNFIMLE